jgi:hypothetical protein
VLIPYHVGVFYSSWDWLAKSSYAGHAVEPLLLISSPFRSSLCSSCRALRHAFSWNERRRAPSFRSAWYGWDCRCCSVRSCSARRSSICTAAPSRPCRQDSARSWEHLCFVAYVLAYGLAFVPFRRLDSAASDRNRFSQQELAQQS